MPPEQATSQPLEENPAIQETSSNQPAPKAEQTEDRFVEPDFSALVEDVDDDEEVVVSDGTAEIAALEEGETESVSKDELAAEQPEETPPAVEEPETPVAESAQEPEVEAAPEPVVPEVKMPTKEELQGMYDDFRAQTLPTLEKLYEMDDETAAAFDENPKQVLSKIAGQLHFDSMMSSYNAVMAAMPSVVGRVIQAANMANAAEAEFYEAWPQLSDAKNQQVVRTAVQAYRTANPTASMEDVKKNAGMMAMLQLGLSLDKKEEEANNPPPKPKAKPARPAAPSGVNAVPPARPQNQNEDNPFGDLAELFQNERI